MKKGDKKDKQSQAVLMSLVQAIILGYILMLTMKSSVWFDLHRIFVVNTEELLVG